MQQGFELEEQFADFFMQKIKAIRNSLSNKKVYMPVYRNVSKFDCFHAVSEADVAKIIDTMSTKSCELDCIPTKVLKDCLSAILH